MKAIASLSLLAFVQTVLGHGGHDHAGPASGETIQQYARRHMSSEHHIDSFDTRSFHQLHDLNRDGQWDPAEIRALYGVGHTYSGEQADATQGDKVVEDVLRAFDLDKDGKVSSEELEKVGLDGLPNNEGVGHHYDVESEFFLHHEEKFHSTPETQTDESYNHPEDIEHFAQHSVIERQEAEKEAHFQGISVEEVLKSHDQVDIPPPPPPKGQQPPSDHAGSAQIPEPQVAPESPTTPHPHDEQIVSDPGLKEPPIPKVTRLTPPEKQEPSIKFKDASSEAKMKGEWGTGQAGYKPPTEPSDKMRKNLPYKYKFRRNWGDF